MSTQTEPWAWPCSPDFPPAPTFLDDDDIDESFEDGGDPEVDFEVSGYIQTRNSAMSASCNAFIAVLFVMIIRASYYKTKLGAHSTHCDIESGPPHSFLSCL